MVLSRLAPALRLGGAFVGSSVAGAGSVVAASEGGEAAGQISLPQLDTSTFPTQLFWLAVSFTLLYLLLSRVTLPRVRRLVGAREERISGDLERAEQLRSEAEIMAADADRRLAEAKREADRLILMARKEAEVICSVGLQEADLLRRVPRAELDQDLDARLAAAEQRVLDAARAVADQVRGDSGATSVREERGAEPAVFAMVAAPATQAALATLQGAL